ncbi:hypothetical protein SEA_DUNCANSLEG_116 [Mycobacterium phage DuncansLeg]|nr:hypothetical protein SEA_DUNCANSLEG_116 [Mycobacterium phage DuncansLeg]
MGRGRSPAGTGYRSRRDPDYVTLYHRARSAESAEAIAKEGFRPGSRGDWVFLSTKLDSHHSPFGDHVVEVRVPKAQVYADNEDQGYAVRVKREHVEVTKNYFHVGKVPDKFPKRRPRWVKNDKQMRPK